MAKKNIEKKIIIDFLNEYWDELAALISGTPDADTCRTLTERFPDDLCEFVGLLSKLISVYQIQGSGEQSESTVRGDLISYRSLNDTALLDSHHTDMKGLLEKAEQFRKHGSAHHEEDCSSIIVKNGLFTVRPQQYNEALNSPFKTLVDSVL